MTLTALLVKYAGSLKIGPAYDKTSDLGPVVTQAHRQSILNWIETGIREGARLFARPDAGLSFSGMSRDITSGRPSSIR